MQRIIADSIIFIQIPGWRESMQSFAGKPQESMAIVNADEKRSRSNERPLKLDILL